MNALTSGGTVVWAGVLMLVLPLLIVVAGELQERLRQRDSTYTPVVRVIRDWVIPLFALWAITRGLLGLENETLAVRIAGTGVVLASAVAGLVIVRVVVTRLRRRGEERGEGRVPQILLALPRVLILIAAGWLLLDGVWGVNLTAAMTALGVTSLVVSFALQDTLSGLASGLLLLSDSPFQPGDWIKVGDIEGRVVDINWRSSRIVNRNGDLLIVPNAQLAGEAVVNFDSPARLHRVVVPVQVAYVNPPTRAKEMLLDAAQATEGVLADPPPTVRVVQIDDPLMGYEVHLWIDDYAEAPRVASDFGSLVWYSSHRHDVPLPSPAYDLYTYDGVEAGLAGIPDRDELRGRLRSTPMLGSLNDDELDRLAGGTRSVPFSRGEYFFREGAADRGLHVLWRGSARLVLPSEEGDLLVTELKQGDVFGLLGTSERWPRPPRVVALEDCEVLEIEESVAGEVTSRNPELGEALNQLQEQRRRRVERMVDRMVDRTDGDEDRAS